MKRALLSALLLAVLLAGCNSWRRAPSANTAKEVPAAGIWQQEEPVEEEQPDGIAVEQSDAVDMHSVSITARGQDEAAWSSSDEMLANKVYSLLTHKNEQFMQPFDGREYDYAADFTNEQQEDSVFYLWINFEKENEIIVEDSAGSQWNLSVEDSNQLRAMIQGLG